MGAPRKHPPKDAAEVIQRLAAQGHSIIGIAKHFNVSSHTVKRWLEEDQSMQDAYEGGRDTQRQALEALIVQHAVAGKAANANAMFLLKTKFGYREFDSPHTKVNIDARHVQNVMYVTDHGTDAEWEKKAAEHQRKLATA
jgi:transposase